MINLEWLRTFRSVYRTKSLSRASELLNISQPTVSQHLRALEAYVGQKLFTRKSKGVIETDDGRILNTLIAGSIELLEEAENIISQHYFKNEIILTIGISEHLYQSVLGNKLFDLCEHVHVRFGSRKSLITDVEEGRLLYAIVPGEVNTFDIISHHMEDQNLVLVHTPDIDLSGINQMLKQNPIEAENILVKQTWYAHDTSSSYIKLFWMALFNKKRPAIIPNYVIPNETEVLNQLVKGSGLSVALETNVKAYINNGTLKLCSLKPVYFRKMSLLSNKKKAPKETTKKIIKLLNN